MIDLFLASPQADYNMEHVVYELNKIGVELAVDAAKEVTAKEPHRPRLVAGTIGPTNRTLSISPSVEDPGARNCTCDRCSKSSAAFPGAI
jgi:5-methyltetrahydrofolate--homocysteine methyltransferase